MKHFGRPFAIIAFATALGLLALWPPQDKIKLGIDLSGGTILVYQAKQGEGQEAPRIEELITALKRRINPEGTKDVVIRKAGRDRVEIILPKASPEEVEDIKRRMTAVGSMQFRVLADRRDTSDASPIQRALAGDGLNNPPPRYRWAKLAEIVDRDKKDAAAGRWITVEGNKLTDPTQSWERDRFAGGSVVLSVEAAEGGVPRSITFPILANTSDTLTLDPARAQGFSASTGRLEDRPVASVASVMPSADSYRIELNPSRIVEDPNLAIRTVPRGNGVEERYVLYKVDNQNVTGDELALVYPTEDEQIQPAVGFNFRPAGATKFGRLTREFSPGKRGGDFAYHLAILLDEFVMSAPTIRTEISERGVIEGVPPKQRDELIDILRAGKLPASIEKVPLQQENIGPTLGKDTIEKALWAIGISMLVVPIFMVVYYHFAGAVAVVALLLNVILLVGSMAFTNSSFTLPGLAGLALTIGMAVDANVLIFERMREEKERGANLATQIRNGFSRAWSTILDSNVTTMLSGMVLWAIGTEEIKGFALTLIIGLVWNLFTAVFVSHVIFDFFYAKGWLKKLTMLKLMDKTNIDFVKPRRLLMLLSAILIAIGLAWFAKQGSSNYNIDFTGGTLVTVQLNPESEAIKGLRDTESAAFVRSSAEKAGLQDVTVESLAFSGESRPTRFNIRTTEQDATKVQEAILKEFGENLSRLSVEVGPGSPIARVEGASLDVADRFAGGTQYLLTFNREVDTERVRLAVENLLRDMKVANAGSRFRVERATVDVSGTASQPQVLLKTNLDPAEADKALSALATSLPNDPALNFLRLENFGSAVAGDTQLKAVLAIVTSWLAIIAYLWFRFKSFTFGIAAVIALVHDVLIALGAVAISPYKIDLPMIAAFLTIIGFSVNDTIVIFDRIREIKGKSPHLTEKIINDAVNQTLSRTILTSLTALAVVLIMYLFGGEGLRGFSFCLLIGFISGIYSTVYIASPILIEFLGRKAKPSAEPARTATPAVAR